MEKRTKRKKGRHGWTPNPENKSSKNQPNKKNKTKTQTNGNNRKKKQTNLQQKETNHKTATDEPKNAVQRGR